MNSVLKKLRKMGADELFAISEAIDAEIERRTDDAEVGEESARHRANERTQSYRRKNGASATPALVVGVQQKFERKRENARKSHRRRAA